jgi:hypothetical protein
MNTCFVYSNNSRDMFSVIIITIPKQTIIKIEVMWGENETNLTTFSAITRQVGQHHKK